jgi:hypothetical protein
MRLLRPANAGLAMTLYIIKLLRQQLLILIGMLSLRGFRLAEDKAISLIYRRDSEDHGVSPSPLLPLTHSCHLPLLIVIILSPISTYQQETSVLQSAPAAPGWHLSGPAQALYS